MQSCASGRRGVSTSVLRCSSACSRRAWRSRSSSPGATSRCCTTAGCWLGDIAQLRAVRGLRAPPPVLLGSLPFLLGLPGFDMGFGAFTWALPLLWLMPLLMLTRTARNGRLGVLGLLGGLAAGGALL